MLRLSKATGHSIGKPTGGKEEKMTKKDYIEAFIDCLREVIKIENHMECEGTVDLIASTFELMRWSGSVDEFICDECLFDIVFGDAEPATPDIAPIPS